MTSIRKQKRSRGDIVQVDLGNGFYGFGQVLESPLMAFFNLKAKVVPPVKDVVEHEVAFAVWVMKYAITDGIWPIIGHAEVNDEINERPPFYKQDRLSGKLSVTYTGAEEEPATYVNVLNLECAAVWDPEHIVDRLNDYFEGRSNKWVESMRPTAPK
jgi:hypothetical protein